MMEFASKKLLVLTLCYLTLPVLVFLLGWCQWYISVPCSFVCLCVGWRMYGEYSSSDSLKVKVDGRLLIFVLLFFLIMAYYLGWGRFTEQMNDYGKHNAILNDLIVRPWPVVYTNAQGEHSMLTYYMGHYLIPACIGKLFSSYRVGEITFALWSFFGLVLAFLNLVEYLRCEKKIKVILVALTLVFFSCPLSVAIPVLSRIYSEFYGAGEWFWWSTDMKLQYASNWCSLQWVAPQTIAVWVVIPLFMRHITKLQFYVPLLLPLLFTSAFAFIGLLPFAIVGALYVLFHDRQIVPWLRKIFSLSNVSYTITIGVVLILYFISNIIVPKPAEVSFRVLDYTNCKMLYVLFIGIMVLPYFIAIYESQGRRVYYWLTLLLLLAFPLFSMGLMNDLMMRASIPALYILMMMVLQHLLNYKWHDHHVFSRIVYVSLVCLLLFSARYPLRFLSEQIYGEDRKSVV